MSSINSKLSKSYGITDLGETGFQTSDGKKFTKAQSRFENWQAALEHARATSGVKPKALTPKDETAARIQRIGRDSNPNLIYVKDRWGRKVRINKNALEDPSRTLIPVYNNKGVKITDSASYDPVRDAGRVSIHKGNIEGTPEYEESSQAVKALEEKWEKDGFQQEDLETVKEFISAPSDPAEVAARHIDRPEYESHPDLPLYRWSNQTQCYTLGHKPSEEDQDKYLKVKGQGGAQYTFAPAKEEQLSLF